MTLVRFVLDEIKDNWQDGTFPSGLYRHDKDDSTTLETGDDENTIELDEANFVIASLTQDDEPQFAANASPGAEAVVAVSVRGRIGDANHYGNIADDDEFATLRNNVKEALRVSHRDIDVGSDHPATWVRYKIENTAGTSGQYGDTFRFDFQVRFVGHY